MRSRVSNYFLIGAALVAFVATGCSSVNPSRTGRKGFIDRLASLEPADNGGIDEKNLEYGEDEADARAEKLQEHTVGWRWPLREVKVTSPFGTRGSEFHEGVDLRAGRGTAVYAVDSGKVIYSGRKIRGYGNLVVIKHPSGLSSVYAHNSKLYVRNGARVKKGQKVALSGSTGHARGPHLHFEVRDGVVAVNPEKLISRTRVAAAEKVQKPKARRFARR